MRGIPPTSPTGYCGTRCITPPSEGCVLLLAVTAAVALIEYTARCRRGKVPERGRNFGSKPRWPLGANSQLPRSSLGSEAGPALAAV